MDDGRWTMDDGRRRRAPDGAYLRFTIDKAADGCMADWSDRRAAPKGRKLPTA